MVQTLDFDRGFLGVVPFKIDDLGVPKRQGCLVRSAYVCFLTWGIDNLCS